MVICRSYSHVTACRKQLGLLQTFRRNASISDAIGSSPVLVSSNKDIYTNLALEHWLFTHLKFSESAKVENEVPRNTHELPKPVVFIWTDEPCIVMGRHQNPWIETNLGILQQLKIKLARRHSGGGCVYHDDGNINISIISHRNLFENRQSNLRFLAKVIKDNYGIECEPNKRHDLIHSETGLKMSGSAAKLGGKNCYHHFTLLVDADKEVMRGIIRQEQQGFIKTNSSMSTRSSVINLKELKSDLTVNQVISDLSQAYGKLYKTANPTSKPESPEKARPGDPSELEQLNAMKQELMSSKWIYNMTPKFTLEQSIDLMDCGIKKTAILKVLVNHGKFEKFDIQCDLSHSSHDLVDKFSPLIGTDFMFHDAMINTIKTFGLDRLDTQVDGQLALPNASEQILATLLLKMIQEAHY